METYKIESKIITKQSYPLSIWMAFKVEAFSEEAACYKALEFIDANVIHAIDIEIQNVTKL